MKTGTTRQFCDDCKHPDGGHYGWCGTGNFECGKEVALAGVLEICSRVHLGCNACLFHSKGKCEVKKLKEKRDTAPVVPTHWEKLARIAAIRDMDGKFGSLEMSRNPEYDLHEPIGEYFEKMRYLNMLDDGDFESPEDLQACIDGDVVWEIRHYYHTHNSFVIFYGSTPGKVVDLLYNAHFRGGRID